MLFLPDVYGYYNSTKNKCINKNAVSVTSYISSTAVKQKPMNLKETHTKDGSNKAIKEQKYDI